MSKFKGTKGKWTKDDRCNIWSTSEKKIAMSCSSRRIEDEANALLISKSPQMLEMLEKIVGQFEKVDKLYSRDKEIINDAKALINEATEI